MKVKVAEPRQPGQIVNPQPLEGRLL
jgi:hypothetical protein